MNTSRISYSHSQDQSSGFEDLRTPTSYPVPNLLRIREELDSIIRWQVSASQALRLLCSSGVLLSASSPTPKDLRLIESLLSLEASNRLQIEGRRECSSYMNRARALLPFSKGTITVRQFLQERSSVIDLVKELIERELIVSKVEAITQRLDGMGGAILFPYNILRPTILGQAVANA